MGRLKIRIIPARAGFTCSFRRHTVTPWDHPRSRGVYEVATWDDLAWHGSSPLARGLPLVLSEEMQAVRIIPARAGFTHKNVMLLEVATDHPRSRGVYSFI